MNQLSQIDENNGSNNNDSSDTNKIRSAYFPSNPSQIEEKYVTDSDKNKCIMEDSNDKTVGYPRTLSSILSSEKRRKIFMNDMNDETIICDNKDSKIWYSCGSAAIYWSSSIITDFWGTLCRLASEEMPKAWKGAMAISGHLGVVARQKLVLQMYYNNNSINNSKKNYITYGSNINGKDFIKLPIYKWKAIHVQSWVKSLGGPFRKQCDNFTNVNGKELLDINIDELSLIITSKMQRRKFMQHLETAKQKYNSNINVGDQANHLHNNKSNININGIVGLWNLGNTCYMNTSIQLLSQTSKLTRYLAKRGKRNKLSCNTPMLDAWTQVCNNIYGVSKNRCGNKYNYKTISPRQIKNALHRIDSDFGSGNQDDSARALIVMLNALDEEVEMELNNNTNVTYVDFYDIINCRNMNEYNEQMIVEELLRQHNPKQSIIKQLFDGVERLSYICCVCQSEYRQYKIFRMLDIPVTSNVIVFRNVNIIINDKFISMNKVSGLDYCSIDVLKYKIIQYVQCQNDIDISHVGIDNIQIVSMQNNGYAQRITSNVTILELLQANGNIFVLIDTKNKYVSKPMHILQFVEFDDKVQISTKCIKSEKGTIEEYINTQLLHIQNKTYTYKFAIVLKHNGKFITDISKLKKLNLKNNGYNNVLVLLCLIREYNLIKSLSGKFKKEKLPQNDWHSSSNDKLSKEETETNTLPLLDINELFTSFKTIPESQKLLHSVNECLNEYQNRITIDQSRFSYKCQTCSKQCRILQLEKRLLYTPEILILHLDRFGKNVNQQSYNNASDKFTHYVKYELELANAALNIGKYSKNNYNLFGVSNHENFSKKYSLYGISNHFGTSSQFGHYTANIKCFSDGNWYRISDSNISFGNNSRDYAKATILMYS